MAVKQTRKVTTKVYVDRGTDRVGRSVEIQYQNADAINRWLEDDGELTWFTPGKDKSVSAPKLRVKTKKGFRVAYIGDTIVRYGSWRHGDEPPFFVVIKKD